MCSSVGPSQRLVVEVNLLRGVVHGGEMYRVDEGSLVPTPDTDLPMLWRGPTVGWVAAANRPSSRLSTKVLETPA